MLSATVVLCPAAATASTHGLIVDPIRAPEIKPGATVDARSDEPSSVPGHLIVKFRDGGVCVDCRLNAGKQLSQTPGSSGVDRLARRYHLHRARPIVPADARLKSVARRKQLHRQRLGNARMATSIASTYVLELARGTDLKAAARAFEEDPAVAYAEPDCQNEATTTVNDPFFSSSGSWGQSFDDLWGLKKVDAPTAWDTTKGQGVVVAVSDTGVDYDHLDIAANIWSNPDEVAGNGIDDDGNGLADDTRGWDFINNDNDPFDDHGHGTHVAGTIAAVADNGIGIAGVAPQVKIMPVKGLDSHGSGSCSTVVSTIIYAAEEGADVINASWGGIGVSHAEDDAIAAANAAGTSVVVAAGNSYADLRNGPIYPAASPGAIAVGATDHLDQRASFSSYGQKLDVTAPGGGDTGADAGSTFQSYRSILSLRSSGAQPGFTANGQLVVGGSYMREAGTSMAAPHAAGVAALVKAVHPSYTPDQVRQALRTGADDVADPGFDSVSGYGRVNAARSIALDVPLVRITSPSDGFVASPSNGDITIDGTAAGQAFQSYTVEVGSLGFSALDEPTSWQAIGSSNTPVTGGPLGVWQLGGVDDGVYVIRLQVRNAAGAVFESRAQVHVVRGAGGSVVRRFSKNLRLSVPSQYRSPGTKPPDIGRPWEGYFGGSARWDATSTGKLALATSYDGKCPLIAQGTTTVKALVVPDAHDSGSIDCRNDLGQYQDPKMADVTTDDKGRSVAFTANFSFRPGYNADEFHRQVFLWRKSGVTQITDYAAQGKAAYGPAISGDGRWITFNTNADPKGENSDGNYEVFLYDTGNGEVAQLTHTTGCNFFGGPTNSISRDGDRIAFMSGCDLTGENPGPFPYPWQANRAFVYDRSENHLTQLARGCQTTGCLAEGSPVISKDGTRVVNYDTRDFGFAEKRWLLIHSLDSIGSEVDTASYGPLSEADSTNDFDGPLMPSISADGNRIAFGAKFDPAGTNPYGFMQVFILDNQTHAIRQVTETADSALPSLGAALNDKGSMLYTYVGSDLSGRQPGVYRVKLGP